MKVMKSVAWLVVALLPSVAYPARPFRGGVVASAHPRASEAALTVLDRGGNAVDAAIAAALTLGVVDPYHSGLGGGGFALIYEARANRTEAFDFRELAPAAATPDMYRGRGPEAPLDGGLSVAVPGAPAGYFDLLARRGKLPAKVVAQPAIRAARDGFWIGPKYRAAAEKRLGCLRSNRDASAVYLKREPSGEYSVPPVGWILRQPELASTLSRLAERGPREFYQGPIGAAVVEAVRRGGGILTLDDLRRYRTRWRNPLIGSYRGHRFATMPPPSAGGAAIVQVLSILESAKAYEFSYRDPRGIHWFVESVRRAYVDRFAHLSDPAFMDVPVEQLVGAEHIRQMASTVDPARATPSEVLWADRTNPSAESKHTAQVSVIDREGNAVSLTTTINYLFGSCLVARGTGILLNDQMDDFSTRPGEPNAYGLIASRANAVAPGKIPLSSMAPTLVYQKDGVGKILLALGSPGGSTIPTTVLQVIRNVLDFGMNLADAVNAGRVHHQLYPDEIAVDPRGLDLATEHALTAMGHKIHRVDWWGDVEAVMVDPGTGLRYASSDSRNEGAGLGQD